jgi:hypothetical protein
MEQSFSFPDIPPEMSGFEGAGTPTTDRGSHSDGGETPMSVSVEWTIFSEPGKKVPAGT